MQKRRFEASTQVKGIPHNNRTPNRLFCYALSGSDRTRLESPHHRSRKIHLRTDLIDIENRSEPAYWIEGLEKLQSNFPQRDLLVTASKTYQKFLCVDAEMYLSVQCLELPVPV